MSRKSTQTQAAPATPTLTSEKSFRLSVTEILTAIIFILTVGGSVGAAGLAFNNSLTELNTCKSEIQNLKSDFRNIEFRLETVAQSIEKAQIPSNQTFSQK